MKSSILILFSILIFFSASTLSAKDKNTRIDVFYFHGPTRCFECLAIEDMTISTVNTYFGKELKDSTVTLSSIDFVKPENEHFQTNYKFEVQTLILSKKVNGKEVKWKNLDKIWKLVNDPDKFKNYVKDEIKKFLKKP